MGARQPDMQRNDAGLRAEAEEAQQEDDGIQWLGQGATRKAAKS